VISNVLYMHQLSKTGLLLSLKAKLKHWEIKLVKKKILKEVPKSYVETRISYRHESELF